MDENNLYEDICRGKYKSAEKLADVALPVISSEPNHDNNNDDNTSKLNVLRKSVQALSRKGNIFAAMNAALMGIMYTIIAVGGVLYWYQLNQIYLKIDKSNGNVNASGNISSLQADNHVLEQRINDLECLLSKTAGIPNCADFYKLGHRKDQVYTISRCRESYQLYCDMTQDGGGWTVIQRRFDGSSDFYRSWDTYKTGFGNLTEEFWLGNKLIYLLTKHNKFDLNIYVEDFEGDHRYAQYSEFQLGDEDEKYALQFGSYSGDAGNSLHYLKGMEFSTYDSDNDKSQINCASKYHGAFWFSTCDYAHLNGQYSATSSGAGYKKGLLWLGWRGSNYSLKKSTMKIRPMD